MVHLFYNNNFDYNLEEFNVYYVFIWNIIQVFILQVIEQDVDMSYFSANNVGEWIVELIYQNNIKKLIMGATSDSHYSEYVYLENHSVSPEQSS